MKWGELPSAILFQTPTIREVIPIKHKKTFIVVLFWLTSFVRLSMFQPAFEGGQFLYEMTL